uniref:Uncharacterized protein n=1 Tax=Phenylobacterium glaciei TaxID=2803784 RepID=A0A974S813_9CAUL|nr:hypothetical protein JKL49_03250 [Phenylobacterium glaciei]
MKGYTTLAGRVAYERADGVTVSLSGQNLLRERQVLAKTTGLQSERRILLSVSKTW